MPCSCCRCSAVVTVYATIEGIVLHLDILYYQIQKDRPKNEALP